MTVSGSPARCVDAPARAPWPRAVLQLLGVLLSAAAAPYCAAILFMPELVMIDAYFMLQRRRRPAPLGGASVDIERLCVNAHGALAGNVPYRLIKQGADRALALLLIVALAPAFVVIAAAIRCDSAGPAFFRQTRIGYRGKPFQVWKFRTMVVAEVMAGDREAAITREGDPRVTRLGASLRRRRIDELPQIINVLVGEMSLIGPRPEAVELSRWYEQQLPFYAYRHVVRPGISGWAQVNQGHVADLDGVHVKLQYDIFYISRCTVWLDLLIVLRTVKTMATGFGSR